ncbi:MAG: M14 family metallopeptidase [Bacteroidota bacterium]|nr:M14 family zinc carboxypeptidase [Bacteroidota bacterium]MDW8136923.1 M14 family metallopeptidase [Bacteroidota bacterium]
MVKFPLRLLLACVGLFGPVYGQDPLYPGGTYRPDVPRPEEWLGYRLGQHFSYHHRIVGYFEALAARSDRMRLERYGQTYERRPLMVAIFSSPENLARLEAIREAHLRLVDPRRYPDVRSVIVDLPIVVWLSYNVHGNEASSSEAAMRVAYQLAAGTDTLTERILRQAVVILDPCLNPDGRDRYASWINQAQGQRSDPNPEAWEHAEPWPGGRTNHYLFDLNRDWAWMTQLETQARIRLYNRWMPVVHVDYHEQGRESPYYFAPAAQPIHRQIPPEVLENMRVFGEGNREAFDARGWLYFTRENFDLLYPGYGDSWPSLNGAAGMTYEQAGGGSAGTAVELRDGTLLRLEDRIRHHVTSSMATLRTAVERRRELLERFRAAFERIVRVSRNEVQAYVLPPEAGDLGRRHLFLRLLLDQGVEVARLRESVRRVSVYNYATDRTETVDLPAGSFVIVTAQPKGALVRALMERRTEFSDSLTYDITAWTLPYAFGLVPFYSTTTPLTALEPVTEAPGPGGELIGGEARYAYLIPPDQYFFPKAIGLLMREGIRMRLAHRPFRLDGRRYPAGTLVIPLTRNEERRSALVELMRRVAAEAGVRIYAAQSGFVEEGFDLGSNYVSTFEQPRIAVLTGEGINPAEFGAIWYLLDRRFEVPYHNVPLAALAGLDLSRYNVLLLPPGNYGRIDSTTQARIRDWIQRGGVLVAVGSAARWAAESRARWTQAKVRRTPEPDEARKERLRRAAYAESERLALEGDIPGALLRVRLDPTHPVAYGYGNRYVTLKVGTLVLEPLDNVGNVAVYESEPLLNGYVPARLMRHLASGAAIVAEDVGRGRVILFADNPAFRAFWVDGHGLLLNAILLGPSR